MQGFDCDRHTPSGGVWPSDIVEKLEADNAGGVAGQHEGITELLEYIPSGLRSVVVEQTIQGRTFLKHNSAALLSGV
jgi:hypothetical protein